MSYEIKSFKPAEEWPTGLDEHIALTQDPSVQILAITPGEVSGSHDCQTGAFTEEGELVGYVAVTKKYGSVWEVGSLGVRAGHRQQGLGHALIAAVTEQAVGQGAQPIAFCNPQSAKPFEDSGYEKMEPQCIPGEALEVCKDCKVKPLDGGCCDTVYAFPSEVEVSL